MLCRKLIGRIDFWYVLASQENIMNLFLFAGAILLAAPATPPPQSRNANLNAPETQCRKTTAHNARGLTARPQRLGELPPADVYAAMVRMVNGCEVPLILTRVPKAG